MRPCIGGAWGWKQTGGDEPVLLTLNHLCYKQCTHFELNREYYKCSRAVATHRSSGVAPLCRNGLNLLCIETVTCHSRRLQPRFCSRISRFKGIVPSGSGFNLSLDGRSGAYTTRVEPANSSCFPSTRAFLSSVGPSDASYCQIFHLAYYLLPKYPQGFCEIWIIINKLSHKR